MILTDPQSFKMQAEFCAALSNEKRLQIIWLLQQKEYSVTELAVELGVSTPNVSQHLKVLKNQSIIQDKKIGQQVYYTISNTKFLEGCVLIKEGISEMQMSKAKGLM